MLHIQPQTEIRQAILNMVAQITPLDALEQAHQADMCAWINSGVEIFRLAKPATPAKHLVSYFVVVDGNHMLLVDHKKAQLWLPAGGHVEPGEHPQQTVKREIVEELGIEAQFMFEQPLLLTVTETVGLTAGHTDVSLWYVVKGNKNQPLTYDADEFNGIRWFAFEDIPYHKADPHLKRMVQKLIQTQN